MRQRKVALFVLLAFIVAGCQTLNVNAKPWAQQTPKERANFMLGIYNAQYDDTMRMATDTTATDAQKAIVVKKKAVLKQIRPLLTTYLVMVDAGMRPTPEDEAALLNLINQLATIGG
jgi:hypothetical protein